MEQLTAYGALLGRMNACGFEVETLLLSVDEWVTANFPGQDEIAQVLISVQRQHGRLQSQLRQTNPASCEIVARDADRFDWP